MKGSVTLRAAATAASWPEYIARDQGFFAAEKLDVTIDQATADVLLYRLPMRIAVSWPGGERTFDVVDSLAHQTFQFEVPLEPTSVRLDPRHDLFFTLIPYPDH